MAREGVLFDLDGTLLDTSELVIKSFQYTLYPYLGRVVAPEEVYPYFGVPLREGLEAFVPEKVEEMVEIYRRYSEEHYNELVRLCPGVREGLKELHQAGVRMGIVTSRVRDTTLYGLRLFGLEDFFQAIITMEDVNTHKPRPEPVLKCLEALRIPPEKALMVGDSPHDIAAARAAGVVAVAAGWSHVPRQRFIDAQPDFWAESMAEVVALALGTS
ncbi:pyrophosphatase PpaX [Thermanaeromonas toyohensis ToBE]|uniref:Pyrophosphatase PpaX n=1 Tax=Thermanaeromonas toyohensis ToBE TaxID=698762 RepID=A0A1W1W1U7_9FIRM|nr:HAD-IA family hydrolase [Thermanaeromonas toyohensis]SMB99588.1 pyrophosphatase PpaX [Thermanaeromonas toyohensis ToBE]